MSRFILSLCVTCFLGVSSLPAQDKSLGKTAEGWASQLKGDADARLRRSAAFALGKMGSRASSAVDAMKEAFAKEKDAKVRDAIVFGLGEICRDSELVRLNGGLEPIFLEAIKDPNAYLRRSGAYALGCLASKSDATRAALDAALGDQEAMVRQNAAYAMAQFKESALPSLKKALGDNDSLVKRDAASVLLVMKDNDKVHELVPDLLPLCRDKNSEVQRAAINVLMLVVNSKDKNAIDPLRWVLDCADVENKRNAAFALAMIGGEEAVVAIPILLEAAKSGDLNDRRQWILAIRSMGAAGKSAVPELIRFLESDKDAGIRKSAALSLQGIGKNAEPAIAAAVAKIRDASEDPQVRIECCMVLNKIGPVDAARRAIPSLVEILADSKQDTLVREKIMWALRIHGQNLDKIPETKDAFTKVCKEPLAGQNKMLRYDCAYMLGMVWQAQAPDQALEVLSEFLKDDKIKVFDKVNVTLGGPGSLEGKKGDKEKVEVKGKGDGRIMVGNALKMIGPTRYAQRQDIMNQLRLLANDAKTDPTLRDKSKELLDDAK